MLARILTIIRRKEIWKRNLMGLGLDQPRGAEESILISAKPGRAITWYSQDWLGL